MKIQKYIMTRILAAGALLLAGSAQLRAMAIGNLTIAAFATGVQGENDPGGQYNGDCLEIPYGNGTIWWDGITFDSAQNSTGSAYLDTIFNTSDGIALLASIGPGFNDLWYEGPCGVPGWTLSGTVDFSQYLAIQFEILWDTTSTLSIDQYNTGLNWPGETSGFNADVTAGVEVDMFTGSGGGMVELGTFLIPDSAATNWQTVTIPINESLPGLTAGAGDCFQKYCGNYAALQSTHNGGFWVDPVILVGNAAPPPSMSAPIAAVPGLNIFNGTETSGSFYDRNEVVCTTTSGLSWIGQSGASYSFNMAGYPNVPAYNGEAYMFLVPNAGCEDNAPDWNEAACMILEVQSTSAGPASRASGQAFLSYKTTAPNAGNDTNILFSSYSGPSAPGTGTSVPSARLLGAYTLTFTENDQGTLATPDGTVGSFSLPAGTGATYFTEGPIGSAVEPVPSGAPPQTNNYPFLIYLGGQANNAPAMNQAVVYQSATISGVAAGTVTENFVTDADTPQALQNWSTGPTSDPDAVVLVPSSAPYWVGWSTPAAGFALLDSPSLDTPQWQPVTTYSPIPMYGTNMQLVSDTDLQSPKDTQYWVVANRRIYNLLIAMPGQTVTISNNGRVSITGTPTTISNGPPWTPSAPVTLYRVTPENTTNSVSYPDGTVLVLAVDIYGKLVTDCTDAIEISCSPTDTNSAGDFHGAGHSAGMTGGIAQLNSTDYGSTFSWGNNDTGGGSPQDPVPSGTKEDIRVWDTYIKPLIKDPITGEPVANPLYSTIGGDGGVNSAQVEVTGED